MTSYKYMIEDFDKMFVSFQSQAMDKLNLYSKGETYALHFLLKKGDYVLPREISEALQCSAARITKILSQLEHKGLITREIDISDRRKIKVRLTESGLARAENEKAEIYKSLEYIFKEMGENDAKEFIRTLKIFFDIANKLDCDSWK